MSLVVRLLALVSALALLAGCGAGFPADAAATVDRTEVPRDLLESIVAASQDQVVAAAEEAAQAAGEELTADERAEVLQQHQREMLTMLIQDTVVTRIAADAGVVVDEADRAELRAEIIEAVEGEERLEELLVQDGLSMELFDEVLVPQQARVVALRERLVEGDLLLGRTVRHILVEEQAEAEEILAELEAGADFGELAEEYSTDPGSAGDGGQLPPAPRGAYVEAFDAAVWEAAIGQRVGPVETSFGYHVLEVLDEGRIDPDELSPGQLDQLVTDRLVTLLEAAYAELEIEVDPAFGTWDPQTRSVVAGDEVGEAPELDDLDVGGLDLDDAEVEEVVPPGNDEQ